MFRRRFQLIAILLAAASVGELALSVLALGHRHTCEIHPAELAETNSQCSHHGHEHDADDQQGSAPLTRDRSLDSDSEHSSGDSCSICRYLAQPVLEAPCIVESFHQPLVEVVISETTFDVATPAHLFPQPRSPPMAA